MALRLLATLGTGARVVKVYRDSEWNEYRARLYVKGVLYAPADAHDDDRESIMGTAQFMLKEPAKAKKTSVAKKAPKNSAVAILKALEAKPRAKNPARKIKKPSKVRTPIKSYEIHAHGQHAKVFKRIAVYYAKDHALQGCKDYVRNNPNDTVKLLLVH